MTDVPTPNGAFVELDINLLDKRELILLGQKSALDKVVETVCALSQAARHPHTQGALEELAQRMAIAREGITVELSARAIRHKAGSLHEIKPGQGN